MLCCDDECLNEEAIKYLNKFTTLNVRIAISHMSDLLCEYSLNVNSYVLIDAVVIILSNEKETISNIGVMATELIMKELHAVLGDYVHINILLLQILI